MDKDVLIVIITSLTTLAVTFGGLIIKAKIDRNKEERNNAAEQNRLSKKETYSRIIPARRDVYQILNRVIADYGASRALVLFSENGGGRPNMGSELKVSIGYEMYAAKAQGVSEMFQRVHVDAPYVYVLDQLINSHTHSLLILTRDLPNCMLKQIYIDNNVQMSLVFKIRETERRFWYASFSFNHDKTPTELINHCNMAAAHLRSVFLDVT